MTEASTGTGSPTRAALPAGPVWQAGLLAALAAAVVGILLAWIPWKTGPLTTIVFAFVGSLALFGVYETSTSSLGFAETHRLHGYWSALLLCVLATVWGIVSFIATPFWWRLRDSPKRDYFATWNRPD